MGYLTIPVGTTPVLIVNPYSPGSSLIVNTDTANSIWIGDIPNIAPGTPNTVELPPLGSYTIGTKTTYAVSITGMPELALLPGGTSWAPSPAQIANTLVGSTLANVIAAAISSAGVPPIDRPEIVYVNLTQTIPAGASFSTGQLDLSKFQSWLGIIKNSATGSGLGTTPYVRVRFSWGLQADAFDPLHVEDWVTATSPLGIGTQNHNYSQGPCFGDHCNITFTNYDTQPVNVIIGIFGSFRSRSRSVLRGSYNWSGGSEIEADGLGTDSILFAQSGAALAPGAQTAPLIINLYNGNVSLKVRATGTTKADSVKFEIAPQPTAIIGQTYIFFTGNNHTGGENYIPSLSMPRRTCTIQITNNDVGNIDWACLITALEQTE